MLDMHRLGPAGRAVLGAAARDRVVARFSPDSAARRYASLYRTLCPGAE
jgi:glycosyltransferase involved in cell wall biosynthesis